MNGGLGPGCVKGIRRGVLRAYGGIQGLRAALTGKHDTLLRRAPGWQGALRTSVSCLPVNAALSIGNGEPMQETSHCSRVRI